jgi:hypothetical protein
MHTHREAQAEACTLNKKQKRRFDRSNQRLCYSFLFTEVFEKGWRQFHVHGIAAGFVSREPSAESSSRSTPNLSELKLFVPEGTVPLGFCCGGCSSTAGYVPGNEARCVSPEGGRISSDIALAWLIISS